MQIKQIITDYIMKSILTTPGDFVVRGAAVPEAFPATAAGRILGSTNIGQKPAWTRTVPGMSVEGDLITFDGAKSAQLLAVAVGQVLKSQGVGAKPAWGKPSLSELGFKIGEGTRNASGTEPLSGFGFTPVLGIFFTSDGQSTQANLSWGVDDGTNKYCTYIYEDATKAWQINDESMEIYVSVGNVIKGHIQSLDGDGFTLVFDLTGVASMRYIYLAIG